MEMRLIQQIAKQHNMLGPITENKNKTFYCYHRTDRVSGKTDNYTKQQQSETCVLLRHGASFP